METPSTTDPVSALMLILAERWVMTLALADGDRSPYPTPLFFALAEPHTLGRHAAPILLFASSETSHHGALLGIGPTEASAAVYLESETVGLLRGVQLRGVVRRDDGLGDEVEAAAARAQYLTRHPIAAPMLARPGQHLYALVVTWAKLTDNRLGFGAHPEVAFASRDQP